MTTKQYETIIEVLAEKIATQDREIAIQKWQITKLTEKLEKAEKENVAHSEKIS